MDQIDTRRETGVTLRLMPLVLVCFLGYLTIAIPLPVLPTQVHDVLGFGTVTVGWTVGIQSIATLLTRQFAGNVCDAHGPRRAVLLGLPIACLAGGCYLLSAVLPLGPGAALAVLFAGRLILGMAESLFLTGTMAWNMARVGPANTGRVMIWQGMAMYGALGLGSVIGLELLSATGFVGVCLATIAVPLGGAAIALSVPGTPPAAGRRLSFWRVIGRIMAPGSVLALATVPFGALVSFLALDYAAQGWQGAGFALLAYAAGFVGVRVVLPGLSDRASTRTVAAFSLAIGAVGQVVLWLAPSPAIALLGAVITGGGISLVFPSMGVEAIRRVPPQNRGSATGGYAAFFDVGVGVAGPVTGAVAALWGYPAVFLAGAVAALLGLVVCTRLRGKI